MNIDVAALGRFLFWIVSHVLFYFEHMSSFGTECSQDSDITFILDNSGSVGHDNYEKTKQFVVSIIEDLNVGEDRTRVAVVTYSDSAKLEFNLDKFNSRREMIPAVEELEYANGKTNTAAALNLATSQIYGNSVFNRQNFQDIIVLFTDGGSNDAVQTVLKATEAKLQGITIIVVAVGGWVNRFEVNEIASFPAAKNVFNVTDHRSLSGIRAALSAAVCDG